MKRLVSAVLALTLLGGTAAAAAPYDRYGSNYDNHYRRHSDNGAAVVAGVGLLALVAILASQQHHRHYHHGWYNRDGRDYRYGGYDRGYGSGYGSGYNDPYDYNGYGDDQRRW